MTSTDYCETCYDGYAAENGQCKRVCKYKPNKPTWKKYEKFTIISSHVDTPPKFNEECESGMYLEVDTGRCVSGCSPGYVSSITDQVFGKCNRELIFY